MKDDTLENAANVLIAFQKLSESCEYKDGTDCCHPDIEFSSMLCWPCNCPLLIKLDGE